MKFAKKKKKKKRKRKRVLNLNTLSRIAQELSSFNLVMSSSQEIKTIINMHEGNICFIKILGILQMK